MPGLQLQMSQGKRDSTLYRSGQIAMYREGPCGIDQVKFMEKKISLDPDKDVKSRLTVGQIKL